MSEQRERYVPCGPSAHVDNFAAERLPSPKLWPWCEFGATPELAAIPERVNCGVELLDKQAARCGPRPVLHGAAGSWSYDELLDKANRIARVLVEDLGVKPGNRVLLRAANNPMLVACWYAVVKAGAVVVTTMPMLRARELGFVIDKAEIGVALCDARLSEAMEAARERTATLKDVLYFHGAERAEEGTAPGSLEALMANKRPGFENVDTAADDVCLIAFTSGTTGPPKGCVQFHRDLMAACETYSRHVVRPAADDVIAGSSQIAFTYGLTTLVTYPMRVGAATVLMERFEPEALLEKVARHRVSILFGVPTAFRTLVDLVPEGDLSSLRKCFSAGETLPSAVFEQWREATGIRLGEGIGTTEVLHIFIAARGERARPGATGLVVPGFEARVLDGDGNPAPPGTVGPLAVRGPTGCRYLDDAERQAGYVRDGWNLTGDAFRVDEEGYYWYQARTDDMIVSAGYNVSGPEVEGVLLEHPKVLECGVIGVPDATRGQAIKAYVVLRDGQEEGAATAEELRRFIKAEIAPYKCPRSISFLDELPRTMTGKLQRFHLRERAREEAERAGGAEGSP